MGFVEYLAGNSDYKYERAALVLRTIGWLSICWGCLLSIYIWMGLKAGSELWLWWTVGMFVAGMAMIGAAQPLHKRQAHLAGRFTLEPEMSGPDTETYPQQDHPSRDTAKDRAA